MTTTTLAAQPAGVIVGVDTHSDIHVAVAIDELGRRLGDLSVPSTLTGSRHLEAWAQRWGSVIAFGVEGTGSWGANLTRYLRGRSHAVVEVNRPDRAVRRRNGKSDPIDAEAAARAVLAGTAFATPKAGDGPVEMIRALHLTRRSAQKSRRQAANQLHALIVTAPDELRDQLRGLTIPQLIKRALSWRPGTTPATTTSVTKLALRSLARRYHQLSEEINDLDEHLVRLINIAAPQLLAVKGLGAHTSAALLIAAGDNPYRLRSESAFAHLCGVAPIPASSGKTVRYRLNHGGDRQANYALYILAITRMAWDPATRAYVERRTTEGKTKKEIIRCLKRHIAREIYKLLTRPPTSPPTPA
ncbi:IS110 family transposase [Streptomyces sp. ID05-26A]|nr:IS110 family transposase [Streptomyces sp. ID05-26A]